MWRHEIIVASVGANLEERGCPPVEICHLQVLISIYEVHVTPPCLLYSKICAGDVLGWKYSEFKGIKCLNITSTLVAF